MINTVRGPGGTDKPPESDPSTNPSPFPGEDGSKAAEDVKFDSITHPLAQWFVDTWGWSAGDALAAEKGFLNNIMKQCQTQMNKYKDIYKKLNPDNQDD